MRLMPMEIAKAVVLAGDCRGEEPWPNLGLAARQLAPVANKPVLFHHLEALAGAGVREAAIVTDETTRACIRDAVGDGARWGLGISYFHDVESADALSTPALADFVGAAPVLVQHGDVLVRERLAGLWEDLADTSVDALVLRHGDDPRSGFQGPTGYILGSAISAALRRENAAGGDLLERLRAVGARIDERDVEACLPCRSGTAALLRANRHMLEEILPEHGGERIFDSELQGRVALHPSAEVRDSLIRGPVVIGPGASISKAYIGPYTSIGADVTIESVEVEHSIVLEGAQIRFLGARLEGSLVGPGARITRAFRVPRALRLSVGGGAEIAMD
jgi:glucose-1-phosphate thymidylyltransferase